MKLGSGWTDCGLPAATWIDWSLRLKADLARRMRSGGSRGGSLLDWGRRDLSAHFRRAPSGMHQWLAEQLDAMTVERGAKLNVIGPRGGAKSTIGTLAHVLARRSRVGSRTSGSSRIRNNRPAGTWKT